MIDIPLNKALVSVETKKNSCRGCLFLSVKNCPSGDIDTDKTYMPCVASEREDCKNVIFRLVDYLERRAKSETSQLIS
jgi:hypothetical protein